MWINGIPEGVVSRLPRYYRYLGELLNDGVKRVSSKVLAERMNSSGSQIRQDLNMFGGFGQQGYGYHVDVLYRNISGIIGLNQIQNIVVIGAGNLGQSLVNYRKFEKYGFVIKGLFDVNPRLFGLVIQGLKVQPLEELERFIQENDIQIAALTVPKSQAPEVSERLVKAGIKGIWNFAHTDLDVPEDVVVENVHLSESLMRLSFRMKSVNMENDANGRGLDIAS